MISRQEELIVALKKKYSYGHKKKSTSVDDPSEHLTVLLEDCASERMLLQELADDLRNYARENLNQIGESDNYTIEETNAGLSQTVVPQKKATKSQRAVAVNLLLEMLKTSSAYEVFQYVTTLYFQQIVGAKEYKFNFLRMHLCKVVDKFIHAYQEFQQINDNDYLLDVLLDKDVYANIDAEAIAKLFWYYNPKIVADVVVNFYQDDKFECNNVPTGRCRLSYQMMKNLLADDRETLEYVNVIRSTLKAQTLLPVNCRSPGVNQLTDQGLTKYQLYQYDELTIYAVEQWLRNNFRRLFINNIKNGGEPAEKSAVSPYYFYQISAARYMLLDPDDVGNANYFRFRDFQTDIPRLVASCDATGNNWGKPVIFCGVINIGGTHYLPYFIYKNTQGKIQVITVDPSPRTHPREMVDRHGEFLDGKLKTLKRISKIFLSVFPGCEIFDPDVSQMLRERDCGPNSATTLLDVLESCESQQPLLRIVNDRLEIDTARLTSHYTNIGLNPYTNTFVYSARLEEDSLASRARWQERLTQIRDVRPLTERTNPPGQNSDRPQSIHDEYDIDVQIMEEYSYINLVESQQQQDSREENISAVHSLLLGAPEGQGLINRLVAEYKRTLVLPDPRILVDFIKSKITAAVQLQVLTSAHASLENLAEDVITVLLREHIPAALSSVFISSVLDRLPPSPDLHAETIVKKFLENDFGGVFGKLPIYQQRMLSHELREYAERAVKKELIAVYAEMISTLMREHCRAYLARLNVQPNGLTVEQSLVNYLFQAANNAQGGDHKTSEALQFLKVHAESKLLGILHRRVSEVQEHVIEDTIGHVIHTLNLREQRLAVILAFITRDSGQFIPFDSAAFKSHLKKYAGLQIHPYVLSAMEVDGYLGQIVLAEVNRRLFQEVKDCIGISVRDSIERFFAIPAIQQELTANQTIVSLSSMLDDDGRLMPSMNGLINLNYLMQRHGDQSTLTMQDYSHVLVSQYAGLYIQQGMAKIILNALHQHYAMLATAILAVSADKLLFENINKLFDLKDSHGTAHYLYFCYMQADVRAASFFAETFLAPQDLTTAELNSVPEFNSTGIRFHKWFTATVCGALAENNRRACLLTDNINNTITHLTYVIGLLEAKAHQNTVIQLELFKNNLNKLLTQFNLVSLGETFKSAFEKCNGEFTREISQIATLIANSVYSFAMIKPGSLTAQLRPILCCLLNIEVPHVLTGSEADRIDRSIMHKCQMVNESDEHRVRRDPALFVLAPVMTLPNAYGKPVTRELLLQCISYWFSQGSVMYGLVRPSLWFSSDHLPNFIQKLISIVNSLPDGQDAADAAAAEQIQQLRPYLLLSENSDDLSIFASNDMADKIKAVLAKTTTLMNATSTQLRFTDLTQFLSLREAGDASTQKAAQQAQPVSEQYIQSRLMEKIRKLRAENPNPVINLPQIRQEIISEAGGYAAPVQQQQNNPAYIEDMPNVKAADLTRRGMQSWGIFGGGLTQIEKDLLYIKKKHGDDFEFNLDEGDVEVMRRRLHERWRKLVMDFGSVEAARHYIEEPDRKDKVYIAVADILTNFYRSKGMLIFNFNLLMPGYSRYPDPEKIRQYMLPKSICDAYQIEQEDSSIGGIPLADLVITRSGYALDIHWITSRYEKDQMLINPYTERELSTQDIDDICRNARAKILIDHVWSNCMNGISERGLELLVEYLNNAIYSDGFSKNYSNRQNSAAFQAYTRLGLELIKFPVKEQNAFWNETIPCHELMTIKGVFEDSRGNCLTQNGIFLARVVLAYRGDAHGLTNKDLVRLSNDRIIPRRDFVDGAKIRNPLERHLYEKALKQDFHRESFRFRANA